MGNWFSPYQGKDWTPAQGYSDRFKKDVRDLRKYLSLQKIKPDLDITTGIWRDFFLPRERKTYYVFAESFNYGAYRTVAEYNYITPIFRLAIKIATEPNMESVFYSETMVIEFPENYPKSPPYFKIDNPRIDYTRVSSTHHIHWGRLCILAEDKDWDPDRDTIWSATLAALDWCVMHYNNFGY
jgi:hypothetical protein